METIKLVEGTEKNEREDIQFTTEVAVKTVSLKSIDDRLVKIDRDIAEKNNLRIIKTRSLDEVIANLEKEKTDLILLRAEIEIEADKVAPPSPPAEPVTETPTEPPVIDNPEPQNEEISPQ